MPLDYVTSFLKTCPGRAFCYDCLALMVGMPVHDVRARTAELRREDGFIVVMERPCRNCAKLDVTVGYSPP